MAYSISLEQNIDELKEMYYERLNKYFSDMVQTHENVDSHTWGSRLWIENMINRLKQAKINTSKVETEETLSDLPDTLLVKCKDGKEILTKKIKMGCVEYQVQVIPWQDSFDIIKQAHTASNHGNIESTKHNMSRKKKCVNSNCIRVFIDLCDKFTSCNQQKLSIKQKKSIYNVAGTFQVIDMTSKPDGEFSHILVYEDMETKLTQLRGLTQSFDIEIAMELFKIFMDLGPPKTLIAHREGCHINVIEIINKLCYPCSIAFNETDGMFDKSFQIKSLVNSWMRDNKSTHWEVGCHVVQWNINNIKLGHKSPYQIVFGSNLDIEKVTTQKNYTSSKLGIESLQTEEDLGFFKDEDIKSEIEDSITISDRSSDPEAMEENMVGVSEELDSKHINSEYAYADNMRKSVDSICKNNESAPLDATKESENARPLDKRSLHTLRCMLDMKEELVEAPFDNVIDTQNNVDPLSNVKNEGNLMDGCSDEMQNVNGKSSLSYKGTEHTCEVNESNMEDAIKQEDAVDDSNTDSACGPTLMDVEEELEKRKENDKIDNAQSICKECNMTISTKAYTCMACFKKVHLFCSERVTRVISNISQVVCLSCVSVQRESRLEESKRKSELHEQSLNKMRRN